MTTVNGAPAKPLFSTGYKNLVLSLLVAAYTFNFIDRTIISTIGQAIKVDLKITDTQLGLLGGLSFAVLYTLLGIPIARLAERFNRVWIITISIIIWSGFTAACGLAAGFLALLALRVGVGIGEAGCSPPSHSLISDYFEPKRRASALSIYAFGIPLGGMIGAVLGGWLAKNFGWRVAFMAVGIPGVIVAALIRWLVKEPPRGHTDPTRQSEAALAADTFGALMAKEFGEIWAVTRSLFGRWPVVHMILGMTLTSFAGYGYAAFANPYFNRTFGLDYATVGLIFGLVGGVSSGIGTLAGGFLTDWASRYSPRWYALVPAIGLALAAPSFITAFFQPSWQLAAVTLLFPGILAYTYLGPTFGVIQNVVDPRRRATAAAVFLFFVNLIALGGGPVFTGFASDTFAQFHFTHPDVAGFWASLTGLFGQPGGPHFTTLCPGGAAPHSAPAALAGQCKAALIAGTRHGIVITFGFYIWGALHYFLASFGLTKQLTDATKANAL